MTWRHTLEITWKGRFPLDMLRYDTCYPQDSDAIAQIEYSLEPEERMVFRTCRLASKQPSRTWAPTYGRWTSFGCGVTVTRIEKWR